jgi:hypothetical protein
MKMIFPLAVTLAAAQLAGCHLSDPRPKMAHADVTTTGDTVCVLLPTQQQLRAHAITINEAGSQANELDKQFPGDTGPLLNGKECVPLYGYKFTPGKAYNVGVITIQPDAHIYTVTFTLWKNGKNLNAQRIN